MSNNLDLAMIDCLGVEREESRYSVLEVMRLAGGTFVVPPADRLDEDANRVVRCPCGHGWCLLRNKVQRVVACAKRGGDCPNICRKARVNASCVP
jgi:hypothetical protein